MVPLVLDILLVLSLSLLKRLFLIIFLLIEL